MKNLIIIAFAISCGTAYSQQKLIGNEKLNEISIIYSKAALPKLKVLVRQQYDRSNYSTKEEYEVVVNSYYTIYEQMVKSLNKRTIEAILNEEMNIELKLALEIFDSNYKIEFIGLDYSFYASVNKSINEADI